MAETTFALGLRKYVNDGVPSSGAHRPVKEDLIDTLQGRVGYAIGGREAVKTDDYTIVAANAGYRIVLNAATAKTLSLDAIATIAAAIEANTQFQCSVINTGAGVWTIDPDGSETINGASTLSLGQYDSATIWTDGTSWRADTNKVPGVGTINMYDIARDGVAFTHSGGQASYTFKSGDVDPDAWYDDIYPSVSSYDALRGVTQIESGSDIVHATAVAGYIRSAQGVSGAGPNGVALFGLGIAAVDDSAVWGINTLLQDSDTRAASTDTGRILVNELDFNVMNPDTQVIGLSLGGNSLAQPTEASAFVVNPLGTGFEWTSAFVTQDGAAVNGLSIGALATSGTSVASQNALISYFDSGGTKRSMLLVASGGFLTLSQPTGTFNGFNIDGGNLYLQTGKGVIVNGNTVLTDRRTGWTAGTGTASKGAFNADNSPTIGATYSQAEIEDLRADVIEGRQRILAIEEDLRGHGIIN